MITDHKIMGKKSKRFGLLDSPKTCLKTQKLLNVHLGLISSEEPVKYSFSQLEIRMSQVLQYLYKVEIEI